MTGLEPARPKARAPKARVYTNFTTSAWLSAVVVYRRFGRFTRTTQRVYDCFLAVFHTDSPHPHNFLGGALLLRRYFEINSNGATPPR